MTLPHLICSAEKSSYDLKNTTKCSAPRLRFSVTAESYKIHTHI